MIDLDGFDAAQAREIIAETLFVLNIGLLVFISVHLLRELRVHGWRETRAEIGNQAAMAFGVLMVGHGIIRGWSTLQYALARHGYDAAAIEQAYPVALVGLAISAVAMACSIRIFSPVRWGNWGWIMTFFAALGFVGWMQAA